jgi:penicillin-binding protein A
LKGAREVPLSEAFALSINPIFGRLGVYVVGATDLRAYAVKFGFTQRIPFELAVDSGTICPADSTYQLAELASGYNQCTRMSPVLGALIGGMAAVGGTMQRPSVVDSITDAATGAVLYRAQPLLWRTVVTPQTATDLRTLMAEVARRGTARRAFSIVKRSTVFKGWEYGGKTGNITRDSLGRVDWFCGFNRNTERPQECIALGAVTVHGAYWTVHSSKLGAEIFSRYVANIARVRKLKNVLVSPDPLDTGTTEETPEQE